MTRLTYFVAVSVDGFIATDDGRVDWLEAFEDPADDYGYAGFYASVDALLMGRRTYEQVRGFAEWPYPDKPTRVLSRRPIATPTPLTRSWRRGPAGLLAELAGQGLDRVWLVGGGETAGAFEREGLIDEYRLAVMPILLGSGVPLLGAGRRLAVGLEPVSQRAASGGVVELVYRTRRSLN